MKHDFILTSEQKSLVEGNVGVVDRVIRLAIQPNEYVCDLSRVDLYQEGCLALCWAAATFRPERCQFATYAFPVIRNHLYDYCRVIQSGRRHIPTVSRECLAATSPVETDWEEKAERRLTEAALLELLPRFKRKYCGTARLGIEALEWKVRGYTAEEIAQRFRVNPNYIRACISRSLQKLRREHEIQAIQAIQAAHTEQEAQSA